MSIREYPGGAGNGVRSPLAAGSGAGTGNKLLYTVGAGKEATLRCATVYPTAGAATLEIRCSFAGQVVRLAGGTGVLVAPGPINLVAGDSVVIVCTVLDAASVFDAQISADEYGVS